MINKANTLKAKLMGIHTHQQFVVYMREDCHICLSEGFDTRVHLKLKVNDIHIIAELSVVENNLIDKGVIGLNNKAWEKLKVQDGDEVSISYAPVITSLQNIRSKIFNKPFTYDGLSKVINDIRDGYLTDIEISSFLTICAGGRLSNQEIVWLTQAMVESGEKLVWPNKIVVDKHCIGGLPGNRTTPIVVSIIAAIGLFMPKTSSRAITSPAGTADTMEAITNVELSIEQMQQVLLKANGCLAWGGSVNLSPADDILIGVEKVLDIDSDGQLIASVLSKKIAAGSTHVLIDIPIGPTAKVRSNEDAKHLSDKLKYVGAQLGIYIETIISDGSQPVGFGIGPMLEAFDVLAVLENSAKAPDDLRDRALEISSKILEMTGLYSQKSAKKIARVTLKNGKALEKFNQICLLQGGIKPLYIAEHQHPVLSKSKGVIKSIDNRKLARLAKLSGAPKSLAAGIKMNCKLYQPIKRGDLLFTLYSESKGELNYALDYLNSNFNIINIGQIS